MPDDGDNFRELMRGVREGSEDAAWELVEQYGDAILRAVRRALNAKLRSKFDSMDFVQLVWSSFFRARGRLDRFDRPEDLAAFLFTMARNKVGMEIRRRFSTAKRNINREHPLDEVEIPDTKSSGRQASPLNVAVAREQWNRMLESQPEHYRRIIELRLQGFSRQEIADRLQLAESTVRRFLNKLFSEVVS